MQNKRSSIEIHDSTLTHNILSKYIIIHKGYTKLYSMECLSIFLNDYSHQNACVCACLIVAMVIALRL